MSEQDRRDRQERWELIKGIALLHFLGFILFLLTLAYSPDKNPEPSNQCEVSNDNEP